MAGRYLSLPALHQIKKGVTNTQDELSVAVNLMHDGWRLFQFCIYSHLHISHMTQVELISDGLYMPNWKFQSEGSNRCLWPLSLPGEPTSVLRASFENAAQLSVMDPRWTTRAQLHTPATNPEESWMIAKKSHHSWHNSTGQPWSTFPHIGWMCKCNGRKRMQVETHICQTRLL